ncbi:hypothetical protein AAFF_G00323450 [Aldrovandia affinis]|uniref:Uncharacterized protein n=1 Tax=Aldrovandia affinis TaxID=143900 RepID=A0AAD7W0C2_9TELE|nr:hypothetical protein AAFF_G00323450 [Aldrovandia affinis]
MLVICRKRSRPRQLYYIDQTLKPRFAMGSYSKNSSNIETMNTVQQLKGVRFGHKFPRHGLKLLHWLANDIIEIDSTGKMLAQQNPNHGEFGFHLFHDSERILPGVRLQSRYFEVGNLHSPGAHALPFKQCQTESDESNTDRIILRLDSGQVIGKVYITEHTPHRSSFSAEYTYCLSKNLIQAIRGKTLQNFMRQAGLTQKGDG